MPTISKPKELLLKRGGLPRSPPIDLCLQLAVKGIATPEDSASDVACGADGSSIERPHLHGLAAGGEARVAHLLMIRRTEIELEWA